MEEERLIISDYPQNCVFDWLADNYQNPKYKGRLVKLGTQELNYVYHTLDDLDETVLENGDVESNIVFYATDKFPELKGKIMFRDKGIDATIESINADDVPNYGTRRDSDVIVIDKNAGQEK